MYPVNYWQRLLAWYGRLEAAGADLGEAEARNLAVAWTALHQDPQWQTAEPVLRAEYLALAAQLALTAGDMVMARSAWQEAIALRPDSYALRSQAQAVAGAPDDLLPAQRQALRAQLATALTANPLARSETPDQWSRRLDRI